MKRYHLLVAAILVLPVFFSCGGKNNPENPNNPSTPTTPTTPTNPSNPSEPNTPPAEPQIEFRRTVRFGKNIVSANGSKDFVAVVEDGLLTKAADNRKIITGSFSFDNSGKTYSLSKFGKMELLENNKIAFTPDGGSRTEYDVEVSEIVSDSGSNSARMNGSWTINETILEYKGGNYTFKGLDLNEVEKKAKEEGFEFNVEVEEGMSVTKIIFTDALMAAEFKNGQSYAAEHNLRLGDSFKLSEFTKGLEGTAKVQFVEELCVVTIETTIDESPAKLRITMKPVN